LDDVIVFSESFQDHIIYLKPVFDCFGSAGLKVNPKKCKFICDEVEYLGYQIISIDFKLNNHNFDAAKNFPIPTNLRQLRQFLGLTSNLLWAMPELLTHCIYSLRREQFFDCEVTLGINK